MINSREKRLKFLYQSLKETKKPIYVLKIFMLFGYCLNTDVEVRIGETLEGLTSPLIEIQDDFDKFVSEEILRFYGIYLQKRSHQK